MFIGWVIKITTNLTNLREKIDEVDKNIIELILKRMDLVHKVGLNKLRTNARVYVPEREAFIFKKLATFSNLSANEVQSFYTEIISFCRKLEDTLSVAIIQDSISLLGLKKIFGEYVKPIIFQNLNTFFTDTQNISYILSPLSEEIILALQNCDWFIINTTEVNHNRLYLLSKYPNEINSPGDITYILTKSKINTSSYQIKENLFFSSIDSLDLEKLDDEEIKILGFVPSL